MRAPLLLTVLIAGGIASSGCASVLAKTGLRRKPMAAGQGGAADMCRGVEGATGPHKFHPTSGPAGLDVTREVRTYAVSADNERELRSELTRMGPVTSSGRRVDAYTAWRIRKRYERQTDDDGRCSVGPVTVRVTLDYSFPTWANPGDGSAELRGKWAAYIRALDAHERGHECIGLQAASEIKSALEAIAPQPDCTRLKDAVDAATKAIVDKWLAAERKYDQVTDNGLLEGATFP